MWTMQVRQRGEGGERAVCITAQRLRRGGREWVVCSGRCEGRATSPYLKWVSLEVTPTMALWCECRWESL
jgi:hypothetical protein